MSKNRKSLVLCTAVAALGLLAPAALTQTAPARSKPAATVANRTDRPLNGKVVALDKVDRTMIIGPLTGVIPTLTSNQVVIVSTNTVFLKNRARSNFNQVSVGDEVRFRSRKNPDGKEVLNFLVIGTLSTPIRPGVSVRPGAGTTPVK